LTPGPFGDSDASSASSAFLTHGFLWTLGSVGGDSAPTLCGDSTSVLGAVELLLTEGAFDFGELCRCGCSPVSAKSFTISAKEGCAVDSAGTTRVGTALAAGVDAEGVTELSRGIATELTRFELQSSRHSAPVANQSLTVTRGDKFLAFTPELTKSWRFRTRGLFLISAVAF
jgi:hypothetical protein